MLKEELDEKIRQHRLNPPPAPSKGKKEEKKKDVRKVKREPSPEKIQKIAHKDAIYVWEKLREYFLTNLNYNSPFGITEIKVCFCNDSDNPYSYKRIFASRSGITVDCVCICERRIKYLEETCIIVQQMAKDNGLTIGNPHIDHKWVEYEIWDLDKWLFGSAKIRGCWVGYTYKAPSPK